MKKLLTLKLSIVMSMLLMTSCAQTPSSSQATGISSAAGASGSESYKVAIVQLVDNGAFTEMREAFIAKMKELGYDDSKVPYDVKNAQGDMSTLNSICAQLKNSDYDLVVPIVTPATQAVVNQEIQAPVVFISVTNPVGAGIMSSMEAPDKNATGTSNIVPVDEIFSLAEQLTPQAKNIGILYCSGEKNAVLTVEKAKTFFDSNSYTYQEVTVTNSSEVQQAAQSLAGKVDAIYVPIDSTVQSAMTQVVEAANANNIPVYGSDPVMVQSGALACVSVSNTQLGEKSAEMAAQILEGKNIKEIPAVALTEYQYVVNSDTAEGLSITLPENENLVTVQTKK